MDEHLHAGWRTQAADAVSRREARPQTTAEAFAQLKDEVAYLRWLLREHACVLLEPCVAWLSRKLDSR